MHYFKAVEFSSYFFLRHFLYRIRLSLFFFPLYEAGV